MEVALAPASGFAFDAASSPGFCRALLQPSPPEVRVLPRLPAKLGARCRSSCHEHVRCARRVSLAIDRRWVLADRRFMWKPPPVLYGGATPTMRWRFAVQQVLIGLDPDRRWKWLDWANMRRPRRLQAARRGKGRGRLARRRKGGMGCGSAAARLAPRRTDSGASASVASPGRRCRVSARAPIVARAPCAA